MNDAEMLSMAGKGCIMQNAHQRLKDLHPELEVIGSNADDAVPHYLRKLYLLIKIDDWLFIASRQPDSSLQCLFFFLRDIHCGATDYHHYPVGLFL
jgi:hypothetical protein